jgi:hypothetical protein
MRVVGELIRDSTDRISRGDPFVESARPRGRPVTRYKVRVRDEADAARAREFGVPLHLVSPVDAAVFGFPLTFPSVVVVWRPLRDTLITDFVIEEFESRAASLHPRLEDLAIILLRIDGFAARAFLLRNREFVRPSYLTARILEEDSAAEASHVRLQEIALDLPVVGDQLSTEVLARQDRNSFTVGLL